ncbi:MBL fold metallo-hydrolase [Mesorhizobium sp. BAC0120]|uniref:MBL fold metallo-hydrolase n=1 Tax=Mesorhizobium sp. BAC0120 TaxID=3090670 RepID=UPI00298C2E4B|nr:MBL fold metallo-hydrolase [Mesorhizobium sp. BAC0120]MDW6022866.1 MBL fold metallo-hydrolase [Mesorhizobium sp. BAC0120]
MRLQLIRNATLKLDYGGATILIDPYLAPQHSLPSYTGRSPNPLVDLPVAIDAIMAGVELVVVSHLHSDHFDSVAKQIVPKGLPLICQPGDEETIRNAGFTDVTPLVGDLAWNGVSFTRCEGSHGLGQVVEKMGPVMGFVLRAPGEPTVYWAGDTVLYPPVRETIRQVKPDFIVTHSCGALWDGDPIVMDAAETVEVCRIAPAGAIVIATHMEALDHATVDRQALRDAATAAGITARLRIPADGETLSF